MRPAVKSGRGEPELTDAVVPPELEEGWKAYVRAVRGFAKSTATAGRGRCASACTFAHVSAVERRGIVFVHRGRPSPSAADDKSMQELLEGLHRSENRIIALYRSMDGGEEFVRLFQSTPTATTNPAEAARYPRYISDLLRAKCNAGTEQLIEQELTLKGQIDDANARAGDASATDRLKAQLTALQAKRSAVERCVAASHEKERLTQFARFCSGACDRSLIEFDNRRQAEGIRARQRSAGRAGASVKHTGMRSMPHRHVWSCAWTGFACAPMVLSGQRVPSPDHFPGHALPGGGDRHDATVRRAVDDFGRRLAGETEKWGKVVKLSRAKAE